MESTCRHVKDVLANSPHTALTYVYGGAVLHMSAQLNFAKSTFEDLGNRSSKFHLAPPRGGAKGC